MLFITPEQQYYNRSCSYPSAIDHLNELCLLDSMQREYAYRQQQILKKQIQKLNQPHVEFTQDVDNYYVVLTKDVNQVNYRVMNKFNNYELRQIGNTLIIKSTKDNFFKNITLPQNVDLNRDITYKVTNNGYSMTICIPKKQVNYQIKTLTFGLPDLIGEIFRDNLAVESKVPERKRAIANSNRESTGGSIKIPITYDNKQEETKVQTRTEPKQIEATPIKSQPLVSHQKKISEPISVAVEETSDSADEKLEPLTGLTGYDENKENTDFDESKKSTKTTDGSSEENVNPLTATEKGVIEHNVENPLKNYITNGRRTVFIPDTVVECPEDEDIRMSDDSGYQSDTEYIPVKRTLSPTLEEVVDQEFL